MEFIDGRVLGRDVGMVSDEVFRRLRSAITTLHAAGIAHNDLHGANILVSDGVPRVVDFASALLMPAWLARSPLGRQLRRSEEHTSELQSLMRTSYAVFCLTKKKKMTTTQ